MKRLIRNLTTYIKVCYNMLRCKRNIVLNIEKNNTYTITHFNMSEEETRTYLFLSFDHYAYKHLVQNEIENITK